MPVTRINPLALGYTQLDEGQSRSTEVRISQALSAAKKEPGQDDVAFSDLARELSANLGQLERPGPGTTPPG